MIFDLTGRTALITGAGQNVGAGIARFLAAQGASIAVNDIDRERAELVAAGVVELGGRSVAVPFDVTDYASVLAGVAAAELALGPIDILVNNAGNAGAAVMVPTQFRDSTPESWIPAIRVNLAGVMHCCRAVVNGMCDRGWGRIITISSSAATIGTDIGVAPYSAGKGGGLAFTRTLAIEVARHGVTANTLALGLQAQVDPSVTAYFASTIPVGRTGTPEDIGAACVWLASNEAAWVTGQTIEINGGAVTT